jgi:hypothetical protein
VGEFDAAFMRHDLAELDATARHREPASGPVLVSKAPWVVRVRRQELERLSPGTLAFLEYRSPRDREIVLKMYGYDAEGNPVNPRPLLGDQGPGTWNARFYREFDMTNDRDLWTDPRTGKLWNPRQILGPVAGTTDRPPYYEPAAWPDIRAAMAEKGFWPLYEGKHIHIWRTDIRPVERWVNLARVRGRARIEGRAQRAVVRRIAAATDERTLIAAVLDPLCFSNDQLVVIESASVDADTISTTLNSFTADFAIRLRVMRHVDQHILRMTPALLGNCVAGLPTTSGTTGNCHPFDDDSRQTFLWQSERGVAEAYGLGPDDFEHILSTFPVFAHKRPAFYAYLKQRIEEWKRELEGGKAYFARLVAESKAEYRASGPQSRHKSSPEER